MFTTIKAWFTPGAHSLRGYLSKGEIGRILVTASITGTIAFLTSVQPHLGNLGVPPKDIGIATFAITVVIRGLQRLNQGAEVLTRPEAPVPAVAILPAKIESETRTQEIDAR